MILSDELKNALSELEETIIMVKNSPSVGEDDSCELGLALHQLLEVRELLAIS